jgi:hypothetical protein
MSDDQTWTKDVLLSGQALTIRMTWAEIGDQPEITDLHIRSDVPLNAAVLRSLGLGALFEECRWETAQTLAEAKNDQIWQAWNEPSRGRRPRAYGVDHFEQVASLYAAFSNSSGKPVKRLAEHFNVSAETVRRWLKEARKRGLLPAHTAGEVPPTGARQLLGED